VPDPQTLKTSIRDLQGDAFHSPFANQDIVTTGVVTGVLRRGFFIQTPNKDWDGRGSDAIFVYSPEWAAEKGVELEVSGECVDFIKDEAGKPVTQIHLEQASVKSTRGTKVTPIALDSQLLPKDNAELALLLNSLEGMLVRIDAGQTFIAPSNRYGDYVLALDADGDEQTLTRTEHRGALIDPANPMRWFPGFRITNYNHAKRLNVGAKLTSPIIGPLNYRVESYQVSVGEPFDVEENFVSLTKSSLMPSDNALTVMTLNCFNLDPHVESEDKVMNPRQDVDDDWGEGRFHTLAQAVVLQANTPDIVALQEIQDNDGAELSEVVDASDTYMLLIKTIEQLSGIRYNYVDVAPELGADGGQPGGNIRNGFLYNPSRVQLDKQSVRVFGKEHECFEGSRKPLLCEFIEKSSGQRLAVINIHLASKRHQQSIFALENPGVDAKLDTRVQQAQHIADQAHKVLSDGTEFYITGDFNDTEHSQPIKVLTDNDGRHASRAGTLRLQSPWQVTSVNARDCLKQASPKSPI